MPITCKWHSGFSNLQQKNSRINLILAFSTRIIGQSLHLLDKQWLCTKKKPRDKLFLRRSLYTSHTKFPTKFKTSHIRAKTSTMCMCCWTTWHSHSYHYCYYIGWISFDLKIPLRTWNFVHLPEISYFICVCFVTHWNTYGYTLFVL